MLSLVVYVVLLLLELYLSGHDVGLGLLPRGVEILLVLLATDFKIANWIICVVAEFWQRNLVQVQFIQFFFAVDFATLVRHHRLSFILAKIVSGLADEVF